MGPENPGQFRKRIIKVRHQMIQVSMPSLSNEVIQGLSRTPTATRVSQMTVRVGEVCHPETIENNVTSTWIMRFTESFAQLAKISKAEITLNSSWSSPPPLPPQRREKKDDAASRCQMVSGCA